MPQQKGATMGITIGVQDEIGEIADTGFSMPIDTCSVLPVQAINRAATLRGGRNPVPPFRGNKDVSGQIVVPVDSRAMWYWMMLMFGDPTTAGGTAAAWQATHDYASGDLVIPTTGTATRYYECTTDAGSSAGVEPTWPTTIGATVVDDGITWTCRAFVHEFKVPDSQPYFTLEETFSALDTPKYMQYLGCKIAAFAMQVGGDNALTASLTVMGADFDIAESSFDGSATDITGTLDQVANFQAAVTEGGATLATVRSLSINIDMDLDGEQYVLGGGGVRGDIPEGVVGVSGQLVVRCNDAAFTIMQKGIDATESSLKLTFTDTTTSIFEMEIQELEYNVVGVPIETPRGLVVTLDYQGYYANGSEASVIVTRLTNIDQH